MMMKKRFAVCLLFSVSINTYAGKPPMVDWDCVNKKSPTVFDGNYYSFDIDAVKKECALHGEYYQVNEYWASQNNWGQEDLSKPQGYKTVSFYVGYHDAVLKQAAINKKAIKY
jgi:hypothetical protein